MGDPDLSRVLTIDFLFRPLAAEASGSISLCSVDLVEPGGPIDIATSPLPLIVQRLAQRQWDGLWAARSRRHGMIPNLSYQSTDAGLNTTAIMLWLLPAAVRQQWSTSAWQSSTLLNWWKLSSGSWIRPSTCRRATWTGSHCGLHCCRRNRR